MSVSLGAFSLGHRLGEGGRGIVYSGVHDPSGLPVAVKVLRDEARDATFEEEIRSLAALDHEHVVTVYDYGRIPAGLRTHDELAPDQPYLVMERGTGTLLPLCARLDWPQARRVITQILGGLGHAHARRRLHLDLKPENVLVGCGLVAPARSSSAGLRLADFGLSRVVGADLRGVSGTPAFMAPEQGRADGDLGPWTDLYAVGCLVWELLCGAPPFDGAVAEVLQAHRSRRPVSFSPAVPVPVAMVSWLEWLLEKSPASRPASAAEAMARLPVDGALTTGGPCRGRVERETFTFAQITVDVPDPAEPPEREPTERRAAGPGLPLPDVDLGRVELQRSRLFDAGLGLLPYRALPMVGRERERFAAWSQLRAVVDGVGLRSIGLRGEASEQRRFARWLCEGADESGCAQSLLGAPDLRTGMATMLHLGSAPTLHQASRRLFERTGEAFPDVASWLARRTASCPSTLTAVIAALAGRLPVVVAPALGEPDGEDLLASLRARGVVEPLSVLVVDPHSDSSADEVLALPPLEPDRVLEVVTRLVGGSVDLSSLPRRLRTDLELLVHVVGEWASAGVLRFGASGFEVPPGTVLPVPADRRARWISRLAQLSTDERTLLERAAVRGGDAFVSERSLDLEPQPELLDRLLRRGLLTRAAEGLQLAEVELAEVLLAAVRDASTERTHIEALLRAPDLDPATQGRLLLDAGRAAEALRPLLDAMEVAWSGLGTDTRVAAQRVLRCLEEMGAAECDSRRGVAALYALWGAGRSAVGVHDTRLHGPALALISDADRYGWTEVGHAARLVAAASTEDVAVKTELLQRASTSTDHRRRGIALTELGRVAWKSGDLDAGDAWLNAALLAFGDDPYHNSTVYGNQAEVARLRGQYAVALDRVEAAIRLSPTRTTLRLVRAEIQYSAGDRDAAYADFSWMARGALEQADWGDLARAESGLAAIALDRGEAEAALAHARRCVGADPWGWEAGSAPSVWACAAVQLGRVQELRSIVESSEFGGPLRPLVQLLVEAASGSSEAIVDAWAQCAEVPNEATTRRLLHEALIQLERRGLTQLATLLQERLSSLPRSPLDGGRLRD